MFVESRANTNVHCFDAQKACWWPFLISNFSQTSFMWHVVIDYKIETCSLNMEAIGLILQLPWC
jgi:hypothetical protein